MNRENQLRQYRDFIINCTRDEKSLANYCDFKRINECLSLAYPEKDDVSILNFDNSDDFEKAIGVLETQEKFNEYDKKGNKQYSNTLKRYLWFLKAREMFSGNIVSTKTSEEESLAKVKFDDSLPLQQIFYGAPGTGKSHVIKEMTEGESVIRTTFHPDSDYSTFVGAYKPTTGLLPICNELGQPIKIGENVLHKEQIAYEFVPQAFLQAYVKAWEFYAEASEDEEPKAQFLVIEEINRGNCAQIFGDLFQLLDRNAAGFSDYPINADKDMEKQLAKMFNGMPPIPMADSINALYGKDVVSDVVSGKILLLPNNLYILATMNTSDQSLFPIDSAFKRRWDWQYMPISKGRDASGKEMAWKIQADTKEYDWWSFLEKINAQIGSTTNSEDKKLGFFFCKAKDGVITSETFVGKVIFYLWNDVFKDYGFEKSLFKDEDNSALTFDKFYAVDANGKTIVRKDKVELFLKYLGVVEVEEVTEELKTSETGNRGKSKYSFDGKDYDLFFSDLGKMIMDKYFDKHGELTFEQIKKAFPDSMVDGGDHKGLIVKNGDDLGSYSRYYTGEIYKSSDGVEFRIYKQWGQYNIQNIIDFANNNGMEVKKCN